MFAPFSAACLFAFRKFQTHRCFCSGVGKDGGLHEGCYRVVVGVINQVFSLSLGQNCSLVSQ